VGVLDNTLAARVEALEAELEAIKGAPRSSGRSARVAGEEPQEEASAEPVSDRRGVVKLLAATAVGAVAATALRAQPAAAADGEPILQGQVNTGGTATILNATDDTALVVGSSSGYGIEADGAAGNALFDAAGDSPLGNEAFAGTLWVDRDGNWWASTRSDIDDGQWRKLAGQGTSGSLHLLASPKRVYDSRPGEPPAIEPKSPLSPNTARTIDPKGNSSGVPAEARGVLVTLTIPSLAAGGFATVWPSGAWPGTSNINFGPNQNIATTTVVGVAPGATFLVQANVATNVIIDIVGYYL
jgi:hypothetical protein